MDQSLVIKMFAENHASFIALVNSLDEKKFTENVQDKWSAGQQLEHIYLSVKPLAQALLMPGFALKLIFGKANRVSKSYEALVEKYNNKLALGGRATGQFVPKEIMLSQREAVIKNLQQTLQKLSTRFSRFKEEDLDTIILPHPLLGKLTLREMMYFTIYHVAHHQNIIKRDLGINAD